MATTTNSLSAYDLLIRARALMAGGHPHQAAMLLDRAKLMEPEKGSIRETLARALYLAGRNARARREFVKALQIDPVNDYAHFGLALSCAKTGQTARDRPPQARHRHAPGGGGISGGVAAALHVTLHEGYDALLFDLDGVLYRGDDPVPGAAEVLQRLRAAGATIRFLTNNSARTPDQVAEGLARMGMEADPREVVTSAGATAALLRREGATGSAFVIGERGIRSALAGIGIEVVDGTPERADLVVVGWDRELTYDRLRTAALLIQRGARLVATNADATYPAPDGLWPGGGAILAAVVTATGATPTVVGKPSRPMFEAATDAIGATHPLVIGDRLDTDVAGAAAMGWDSLLVLTGASRNEDLLLASALPTYIAPGLQVLLEARPPAHPGLARPTDAAAVEALLAGVGLSATEAGASIAEGWTVILAPSDAPLATAAVVPLDAEWGLLCSVATDPSHRGAGFGSLAVAAAAARARERGLRSLALFTESAERFFAQLGFHPVDRADLPTPVRATRQAVECASATAMTRRIAGAD